MALYNDQFGGSPVQPANVSYAALTLSASIAVFWPPFAVDSEQPIARIMDITASVGSLTITMPDARQAGVGQDVLYNNRGANTFTVLDNTGATIATVAAGQQKYLYLSSNATQAGTWGITLFGVGVSSVDAAALAGYGIKAIGSTLNQSTPLVLTASNQAINSTFRAQCLTSTGGGITYTLAASGTVGNDFFFLARNQGTGVLTIAPSGGELIDGVSSIQLQLNESCTIIAGTGAWYTVGRGRSTQFNFTQLTKTVTGGTVTLTLAEASNIVQNYNGTLLSPCIVVLPAVVQVYYIFNNCVGAFSLTFKSPVPGTTFVLPANQAAVVFCDGVNVVNTTTAISGISSLLLNAGSAALPSLAFVNINNGIFAPSSASIAVTTAGVEHIRWGSGQSLSVDGTAALPAYSFLTEAGTGIYRTGTATLGFSTGGASRATFDGSGHLVPAITNTQTLGSVAKLWSNVYATTFTGNATTATTASNALQLLGATWAAPAAIGSGTPANGSFVDLSATGIFNANAVGGGAYQDSSKNFGIGVVTSPLVKFHVAGPVGANPATSGSSVGGIMTRLEGTTTLGTTVVLDHGIYATNNAFWLQTRLSGNNATNYTLMLNPNGGNVGVGASGPTVAALTKLHVYDSNAGTPTTSGSATTGVTARLQNSSVNLDIGTYGSGACFVQPRLTGDNSANYDLALNPNGANLGFGVLPNTGWGGTVFAMDIRNGAALYTLSSGNLNLSSNIVHNGTNALYKANGFAAQINVAQSAGAIVSTTYSTGTVGNTAAVAVQMSHSLTDFTMITALGAQGYGAGAGGSVTQATSRTTAVTLNKPTGAITLVSAAGSVTAATFTINNSLVAATDCPHVVQKSGTDAYIILVTNVTAGSFKVTFYTTGGTTVEQPVFTVNLYRGAIT